MEIRGELCAWQTKTIDGWGFGELELEDSGERVRVTGTLTGAQLGAWLVLEGEHVESPRWGKQFRAVGWYQTRPASASGVIAWLTRLPEIGRARARALVDAFGVGLWDVIEHRPAELSGIPGLTPARVAAILEAYAGMRDERDHAILLRGWGFTDHQIAAACREWIERRPGAPPPPPLTLEDLIAAVRVDPYELVRRVTGIGFKTADAIATRMGVAADSPQRIAAALEHVLESACTEHGHCFLTFGELVRGAERVLGTREFHPRAPLEALAAAGRVVIYDGTCRVYLTAMDRAEAAAAAWLRAAAAEVVP